MRNQRNRLVLALVAVLAFGAAAVMFWLTRDHAPRVTERREGVLLAFLDSSFADEGAEVSVVLNGKEAFHQRPARWREEVFVPLAFPDHGWLQIRQHNPYAAVVREREYWFPLSSDDAGGYWRVELREIAHVRKYGPYEAARGRRQPKLLVEPPDYGVLVTNVSSAPMAEVLVSAPSGELRVENLKPRGEQFVYWGIPMVGVKALSVTVRPRGQPAATRQFPGLQFAPEDAHWWPRRWDIEVVSESGGIKR